MVALDLSPTTFYVEVHCFLYTHNENFYHKGCLILSNSFYASIEMIMFFTLHFVNVVYHN